MNLELAEGTQNAFGRVRMSNIKYLPHPNNRAVFVREDQFDTLGDDEFNQHLSEAAPELSEFEYQQLSGRRKQRKEAKRATKQQKRQANADKKTAKAEVKKSKAQLKRDKGQAKIIKAGAKQTAAETGNATKWDMDTITGGIKDVAGSVGSVIGAVRGGNDSQEQAQIQPVPQEAGLIAGIKPVYLIGGVAALGLIILLVSKRK